MFSTVQELCLGAAAVFDTVLLLALLERRNWPFVRLPIMLMLAGAWLWHAGQFADLLLGNFPGTWPWYLQGCCMLAMAAGLLLMPCGMLHGAFRIQQGKLDVQVRGQPRYAWFYAPMLFLVPLATWFFEPGRRDFYQVIAPLELAYVLFIAVVDVFAAVTFFSAHRHLNDPQARRFFYQLAVVFFVKIIVQSFVYLIARAVWPQWDPYWLLFLGLAPLAPALLFAYFVIRYGFLQIMLERSLVYGAILGSILFLHQLAFQDVSASVPEGYRLHVVLFEAIALTTLIVIYQPLRQRTAEALRYFLGSRVADMRERLRRLSIELSGQAGRPPGELLAWFGRSLRDALQVEYVAGCLFDRSGGTALRWCEPAAAATWPDGRWTWLYERMQSAGVTACSRRRPLDGEALQWLQDAAASLAVIKSQPRAAGLLVIGRGWRNRDLGEEEVSAVLLLAEQLAVTLENCILHAERLAAEHKAMQSEKLSALGLLASSIAHEVKNPLSAIKTIATVLAEDLGPDHSHAEDVRLILGEVQRLAETTAHLLESARSRPSPRAPASVADTVTGTMRLLRHLARQQEIIVETRLADNLPLVRADEHSLHEIFFNLLSNSLEAAGPRGQVTIACRRDDGFVVAEVHDNGPGITDEVRARLFEPFQTTKDTGTGLGLYVVGRRIGEIGGRIRCDSGPGQGTRFTIQLPCEPS